CRWTPQTPQRNSPTSPSDATVSTFRPFISGGATDGRRQDEPPESIRPTPNAHRQARRAGQRVAKFPARRGFEPDPRGARRPGPGDLCPCSPAGRKPAANAHSATGCGGAIGEWFSQGGQATGEGVRGSAA